MLINGQLSNQRFYAMLTLVAPSRKSESNKVNGSVVWHGDLGFLDAYVMIRKYLMPTAVTLVTAGTGSAPK